MILPIYNADGHERSGPYNRINQNGPEEMGWRTTALNLNLNRDYMKADAPETRAFLRLWNRWLPDYFVDDHVTDGLDYQYDVTYQCDWTPDVVPAIAEWQRRVVEPYLAQSVAQAGHVPGPYIDPKDASDLSKGMRTWPSLPRYSNGYANVQNRPGMLVETHMLKDYRTRVGGTYAILRALLELVNRDADALLRMNREADAATIAGGKAPGRSPMPLLLVSDGTTEPFVYKGIRSSTRLPKSPEAGVAPTPRIRSR